MATGSWLWVNGGGIGGQAPSSPSEKENLSTIADQFYGGFSRCCIPDETFQDCAVVHKSIGGCGGNGSEEIRTPELSSPCSSPGARQEADDGFLMAPCSSVTPIAPCSSPPRVHSPRKKGTTITAAEAYNKGMLLQYIVERASQLDCCHLNSTQDCYETNWEGHLPLTPMPDDDASIVSASEHRLMRRRRRRGLMSPTRQRSKIHAVELTSIGEAKNDIFIKKPNLPGFGIPFPEDVVDPHITARKKWQPSCDGAILVAPGDCEGTAE